MSGGGSSGKNYYGFGKGKGRRKGDPIIWEGPLGPDSFPEPVFELCWEFTNLGVFIGAQRSDTRSVECKCT